MKMLDLTQDSDGRFNVDSVVLVASFSEDQLSIPIKTSV